MNTDLSTLNGHIGDIPYLSSQIEDVSADVMEITRIPKTLSYEQVTENDYRILSGSTVNTAYTDGSKYIRDAYPDSNDQTKYSELFLGSRMTTTQSNQHWRAGLMYMDSASLNSVNGFIAEVSANSVSGYPLNVEYPTETTHAATKGYVDSAITMNGTYISTEYNPDKSTEHDVDYPSNTTNIADGFLGVFIDMNALDYSNVQSTYNALAIHSIEVQNGSGQTSKHGNRPVYASLYETVGKSLNSAKYICSNTNGAQNNRYSDTNTMTFVFDDPIALKDRDYLLLFHETEGVEDNPISSCLTLGDATSRGLRVSVVPGPTNEDALETSSDMAGLSGGAESELVLGRTNTEWIPQFIINAYDISSSNIFINGNPIISDSDISDSCSDLCAWALSTFANVHGALLSNDMQLLSAPMWFANRSNNSSPLMCFTSDQHDKNQWTTKYYWNYVTMKDSTDSTELSYYWKDFGVGDERHKYAIARRGDVSSIVNTEINAVLGDISSILAEI